MSNLTITTSNDFNSGNHKVAFDYMLLKSPAKSLVGEKVDIKTITVIEKLDQCEADSVICFIVELEDGRSFEANAKPQVYAKLSVGSDPILKHQNPTVTGIETGVSILKRATRKIVDAVQCGSCGS
jgi:hypothetical protein